MFFLNHSASHLICIPNSEGECECVMNKKGHSVKSWARIEKSTVSPGENYYSIKKEIIFII